VNEPRPPRICAVCGKEFQPAHHRQTVCSPACRTERRLRQLNAAYSRQREIRDRAPKRGSVPNFPWLARKDAADRARKAAAAVPSAVLCKCPACEKMHRVKMRPPRAGFTPRIYCEKCEHKRYMDEYGDPLLDAHAVGW